MNTWFANNGQILQVVLTAVGIILSLVIAYAKDWLHLGNLRPIFGNPIVPYLLVFLLAEYILIGFIRPPTRPPTRANVFHITRTVGDFWEWPDERIKIEFQKIEENKQGGVGEGDYLADLCIDTGFVLGGSIFSGDKTTNISTNCYRFTVANNLPKEPYSVYFYYYSLSDPYIKFFSARVEHVNPNTHSMTLEGCYIYANNPSKIVE